MQTTHFEKHRIASPAKLNLFLHIVGRLDNGYHQLQSVFQLIDLYDWLEFQLTAQDEIQLFGLESIDTKQNLIFKAAEYLMPYRKIHLGVHIHIEKNIPMGAGLGGGSSNAATTLLVLNKLWQCGLSIEQLAQIAAKLGADVPFFIYGKNAWAEGIGDRLTPIDLPQKQFIILKPDCFISTQYLFSQKTLTRDTKITTFTDYQKQPFAFVNNFEPVARELYPEVNDAMLYLENFAKAYLTGTGACVFIAVDDTINTQEILLNAPCKAYLVNSLEQSPVNVYL